MNLFRQEAIEARTTDRLGSIRLSSPKAGWLFLSGSAAILFALFLIGIFGSYARIETVSGRLVPASGQATIIAQNIPGGMITEVLVRENEHVYRGQPLARIENKRNSAALGDTGKILFDQLTKKITEIKQSIDTQKQLSILKENELKIKVNFIKQRVARLDDQVSNQELRYESAKKIFDSWKTQAGSVVSGYQIAQQYDNVLQQKSLAQGLREQRTQALSELAQVNSELAQLPYNTQSQLSSLSTQMSDVLSARAENEQSRETIIKSPDNGVVTALSAHAGQPATSTVSLMSIIPDNTNLVAELWVPSRAIGFLRVGAHVSIGYAAFPAERYGWQRGKILEIASNATPASELSNLVGHEMQESAYRVIVEVPAGTLPKSLSATLLKPGMALSAKVSVENRRLIDWLIKPFQSPSR